MTDELDVLRAANPVATADLPAAPDDVYLRIRDSRRRRPSGRILALGLVAAAIASAVALLPDRVAEAPKGGVLERALAAVSDGPVLHVLVENTESHAVLVDLESGEETVEPERHEYWYDEERRDLRARLSVGSEVMNEFHVRPPLSTRLANPRALTFGMRYRQALARGEARVVRWETVDGRRSPVLSIAVAAQNDPQGRPRSPAYTEEVVVDGETYKPLRFRHLPGPNTVAPPVHWWRVLSIEASERDDADFKVEPSHRRAWRGFAPSQDRKITEDEAATALGRPAVWAGPELRGLPVTRIGLVTTTVTWLDGRTTTFPSLFIRYEDWDDERPRSLWMSVGRSREEIGQWGPVDGLEVPEGKVRLKRGDGGMWFGNVQREDGVYVNLQGTDRELVLAAARSLQPLG